MSLRGKRNKLCYADRALESITQYLRSQSVQQQKNNIHVTQDPVKSKNSYMEFLGRWGLRLKKFSKHNVVWVKNRNSSLCLSMVLQKKRLLLNFVDPDENQQWFSRNLYRLTENQHGNAGFNRSQHRQSTLRTKCPDCPPVPWDCVRMVETGHSP